MLRRASSSLAASTIQQQQYLRRLLFIGAPINNTNFLNNLNQRTTLRLYSSTASSSTSSSSPQATTTTTTNATTSTTTQNFDQINNKNEATTATSANQESVEQTSEAATTAPQDATAAPSTESSAETKTPEQMREEAEAARKKIEELGEMETMLRKTIFRGLRYVTLLFCCVVQTDLIHNQSIMCEQFVCVNQSQTLAHRATILFVVAIAAFIWAVRRKSHESKLVKLLEQHQLIDGTQLQQQAQQDTTAQKKE